MIHTIPKSSIEKVRTGKLRIDKAYQRIIREATVRKIVKNFKEEAFGALVVGRRESGTMYIVDGQQRWTAAKRLKMPHVTCAVFDSQGKAHEAEVFRTINKDRTGISALLSYRAARLGGDAQTMAINKIVEAHGFQVPYGGDKRWPNILTPGCLYDAYREDHPEYLELALQTIKDAWPGKESALSSFVISGLAQFWRRFAEEADYKRLLVRLKKMNPDHLRNETDAARKVITGTRHTVFARMLVTIYNKGTGKGGTLRGGKNSKALEWK